MISTSNEGGPADPNGPLPTQAPNFWEWLTKPSASIRQPEHRRRARLLSALLATLFLLGILSTALTILVVQHINNISISAGETLVILAVYGLSRTRYYNLAAVITVATISGSIFLISIIAFDTAPLYLLMLGVLFSSLFLTRRDTMLVMIALLIGLGLLWASFPTMSERDVTGAMFAVLAVGVLGIVSIQIREEDMRQIQEQGHLLIDDIAKREQIEQSLRRSEERFRALVEYSMEEISLINAEGKLVYESPSQRRPLGYPPNAFIGHNLLDLFHSDDKAAALEFLAKVAAEPGINHEALFRLQHQDGSWRWMEGIATNLLNEPAVGAIVINYRDVTARLEAEEERKRRLADFEAVNQLSTAMRDAQTLDQLLPIVLNVTLEILGESMGSLWLYEKTANELYPAVARGYDQDGKTAFLPPEKPGEGLVGYVFASGEPLIESNLHQSTHLPESVRSQISPDIAATIIPIRAAHKIIGALSISTLLPRQLTPNEIHLLNTLSEIAGNTIQRTMLYEQTERRMQHLMALSEIDRAISSSFGLNISLETLLHHVTAQLGVDAADVLLFDSNSLELEHIAENGFHAKNVRLPQRRLDKSCAGEAILSRQMIKIEKIEDQQKDEHLKRLSREEGFVSYYAVPLAAKGYIKGVLEIFNRSPIKPDEEWLSFLNTLARQAAIAVDNASLFTGLQRSNAELSMAYDATIEGWSRALDLRDKETEGHTRRVTEMTMKLARTFDLSDEELAQVRWGALLHDIGKMGVPDTILLKPGPLTDEEWATMKKHPAFAYEMLSPIHYLHAALDIPYCHHEKWDGTGYPRGLKGEQIPLSARIFAIVDVWDALRSDRPYRPAWPREKVYEHIKSLAGTHFDPRVVQAFLNMIEKEKSG